MTSKRVLGALLTVGLAVTPATQATADAGKFLLGVGAGVAGAVIVNQARKGNKRTYSSSANSYARQQMRDTQTALNYFGFPAGTPDGVAGRNTRNAMSQFQSFMGYPITGSLSEYERSFLVTAHQRALAGGPITQQQIARNPQGPKGLLLAYRQEATGVPAPTYASQQPMGVQPQGGVMAPNVMMQPSAGVVQQGGLQPSGVVQQGTLQQSGIAPQASVTPQPTVPLVVTPGAQTVAANNTPQAQTPAVGGSGGALPTFGASPVQVSMASHCNQVSLMTNTNGGFTQVSQATDPDFVGSEQFCVARAFSIAASEAAAEAIPNMTMAQMDQQCLAYVEPMRPYVGALSIRSQEEVIREVSNFALSTGTPPAQLATAARICLGSGYRTDNADLALSSALLLVALGEPVYAELMGHHLARGFGASARNDYATGWYQIAISALENGAQPAFAPGQTERTGLLRVAAGLNASGGMTGATALPAFQVPSAN